MHAKPARAVILTVLVSLFSFSAFADKDPFSFLPAPARERFFRHQMTCPTPESLPTKCEESHVATFKAPGLEDWVVVRSCLPKTDQGKQNPPDDCQWVYEVSLRKPVLKPDGSLDVDASPVQKMHCFASSYGFTHAPEFQIILNKDQPLLLLDNQNGGNCRNCESSLVVSLTEPHQLELAGIATYWKNESTSRMYLIVQEDCFEDLPWLSHAQCPSVPIYCTIKNGKLAPDEEGCREQWKTEIKRSEDIIVSKLQGKHGPELSSNILSESANLFLLQWLSGQKKKALKDLKSALSQLLKKNGGKEIPLYGYPPVTPEEVIKVISAVIS